MNLNEYSYINANHLGFTPEMTPHRIWEGREFLRLGELPRLSVNFFKSSEKSSIREAQN